MTATIQSVSANEYILDTSAIRGLPTQLLKQVGETGTQLVVSPISIWELLKHVDTDFAKCRNWILKVKYCQILNHPNAELFDAIGDSSWLLPQQRIAWREREAAEQIIPIIEAAREIDDVYAASFVNSLGERRTAQHCGQNARTAINRLSGKHVELAARFISAMVGELERLKRSRASSHLLTDEEYLVHIGQEISRIASRSFAAPSPAAEERIWDMAYFRIAYALEVAISRTRDGGPVDANDYADAILCGHLSLVGSRTLVTADGTLYSAVRRAQVRSRRLDESFVREHPVVLSTDEFRALFNSLHLQKTLPIGRG